MPLPPQYSTWRHLLSVLIRTYNPKVKEWFKDIKTEDLSIEDPRQSLRTACLIGVNDSAIVASIKMALFDKVRQGWGWGIGGVSDVYGIPIDDFHERVQFKPQISLLFRQSWEDVQKGKRPIESQVSFRIFENPSSISESDLKAWAKDIDRIFGPRRTPYYWQRGRVKVNYTDPDNGYRIQLLASSEQEGKDVISRVLQFRSLTPDYDFLTVSEAPNRNFRSGSETKFIAGASRNLPRERPIGQVVFRRAELKIWGVRPDITLVDYTGLRSDWLNRP